MDDTALLDALFANASEETIREYRNEVLLQQLISEVEAHDGWITITGSGYWLCSEQVSGCLVRKYSPDEVDALLPHLKQIDTAADRHNI